VTDLVPPAQKLVLIVDDDESLLDLMEHVVKKEGFRTDRATDGQEALRKVEALQPDLLILDFMLPGLGGYEALRELQARGCGDIPIVVVTGRAMDGGSIELVKQEPNVKDFIQKPVRPAFLSATLHRILGTQPPHSPRREGF
jgi:two-component system, OmpR family, response regulator AdeR